MELLPQTPEMILSDWDYFDSGIESTARKVGGQFKSEQVYQAMVNDLVSVLYVISDGEKLGFLVVSDYTDMYTRDDVFHVDIAWLTGSSQLNELNQELTSICEVAGFDRLEFSSTRKGWFKYLEAAGFKAAARFSKEI
jgi:hypothetical protein